MAVSRCGSRTIPVSLTMASEFGYLTALLMGLAGSVHCLAMCGGLSSALGLGSPASARVSPLKLAAYQLLYNTGRIASYTAAGVMLGALGQGAAGALPGEVAQALGRAISAAFFIALGLYLADWWHGLSAIERIGARAWRRLAPTARRLLPVRGPGQALLFGVLWGWLPCGLVYSALAWSLVAADPIAGGLRMLCFGLGTLPMLLVLGVAGGKFGALLNRPLLRQAMGVAMIALGVVSLLGGMLQPGSHLAPTHASVHVAP